MQGISYKDNGQGILPNELFHTGRLVRESHISHAVLPSARK